MGFMSVSGLNINTEVIPYREGGMNTTTQKMPGQSDFAAITLSKGVIVGNEKMLLWMRQLFTVQQGTGINTAGMDFRANIQIKVLDHPVTKGNVPVKAVFKVYNAWPTAIAFSDLDAGANAILVQQMTLAHEGFDYKLAAKIGPTEAKFTS
jgi:phage tail-like protein